MPRIDTAIAKAGPEAMLQAAVAEWLQIVAPWGSPRAPFLWFSIPNESKRSQVQAMVLKAMGLRPGAPDLVFVWSGGVAFVELKAGRNRQTSSQWVFEQACDTIGVPYRVCRSLDQVADALTEWGVGLPRNTARNSPRTRSAGSE